MLITADGDASDGEANVWNIVNGKWLFSLEHADTLHAAQFSSDGNYILTAGADHTAKIWDSSDGKLLQTLKGHSGSVFALDISNNHQKVITASADKSAKIWDLTNGYLLCSLDDHEGMVWDVRFSPDDQLVITVDTEDQGAKIWDAVTGVLLLKLENPAGTTFSALFSPNGHSALTAQAMVVFNPNVYMIEKTFSKAGSTLVDWNLLPEIRDPHQISLSIKERIPFHIKEGRLLPVMDSQKVVDIGDEIS